MSVCKSLQKSLYGPKTILAPQIWSWNKAILLLFIKIGAKSVTR